MPTSSERFTSSRFPPTELSFFSSDPQPQESTLTPNPILPQLPDQPADQPPPPHNPNSLIESAHLNPNPPIPHPIDTSQEISPDENSHLNQRLTADITLSTIASSVYGLSANAIAAVAILRGHHALGAAILASPISFSGIGRTPWLIFRIHQELKHVKATQPDPYSIQQHKRFFRFLLVLNLINLPPGPIFPFGTDSLAAPLLTAKRTNSAINRAGQFIGKKSNRVGRWLTNRITRFLPSPNSDLPDHDPQD